MASMDRHGFKGRIVGMHNGRLVRKGSALYKATRGPGAASAKAQAMSDWRRAKAQGVDMPRPTFGLGAGSARSSTALLHAKANRANEERYQNILGEYDRAEGLIEDLGQTEHTRIDQKAQRETARSEQDLMSRGLGNTTIRESVRRGIGEDAALLHQGLAEQVGAQKSNLVTRRADFMERRTDKHPDLDRYAALKEQLGRGAGAFAATRDAVPPQRPAQVLDRGGNNRGDRSRSRSGPANVSPGGNAPRPDGSLPRPGDPDFDWGAWQRMIRDQREQRELDYNSTTLTGEPSEVPNNPYQPTYA